MKLSEIKSELKKLTTIAFQLPNGDLYMRNRVDSRQDSIIKEILFDFEILTRYDILMWFDDRQQVVDKIRSRGVTVFQVAPGNF